ncbi:MAG: CDC27 family protein [Bacteroidales bacterium]|nr:CDC27 family protein [Bacteroidales bacterium]MDD3011288.1 CDC27 family protein [Bacteroidales bacterium]MDD3961998.1 CDC27 family protein [Bacteroidales bacterium]HPE87212.1 CDC27 family protein [Bacteroidales bacterium]
MKNQFFIGLAGCCLLLFISCSTQRQGVVSQESKGKNIPRQSTPSEISNRSDFIEATSAFLLGDDEKAMQKYLKVLGKDPKESAAAYQLARIYRSQEKTEEALEYAQLACDLQPENRWYIRLLSEIYQQNNAYKPAAEMMARLVELEPSNSENLWVLANLYIYAEQYNEAIRAFERLEKQVGISEEITQRKIKIYEHLGKKNQVLDELHALTRMFPGEVRYLAMLAEKLMAYDRPGEALEYYRKISEIDPSNPYIHITMAEYYRKTGQPENSFAELKKGFANPELDMDTKIQILLGYYSVTEIFQDLNPEAYTLLRILVDTHPNDPKAWSMYGDFLFRDKNKKEASRAYLKVLEFDKSKYIVWESLMHALLSEGDFASLEPIAEEALGLFPYQPVPYLFNGFCAINSKNYPKAITVLNEGLTLVVDNPLLKGQFYSSLGDAFYAIHRNEEAFAAYDKSVLLDPENSYVLNNYSYYLALENRELEKAEIMAKKAVFLDSENPNNLDTYAWVLYQLGKYEKAREFIHEAMTQSVYPDPTIFEHYGDIMYRLGNTQSALEYWKKAVDAGGDSESLLHKLKTGILNYEK